MQKLTVKQKTVLARNIRFYRGRMFPSRGCGNRLAAEVGISPQLMSQWANGSRVPSFTKIALLAKLFNTTPQELCGMPKNDGINPETAPIDITIAIANFQKKSRTGKISAKESKRKFKSIKDHILSELCDL